MTMQQLTDPKALEKLERLRVLIRRTLQDTRARSDLLAQCDELEREIRKLRAAIYEGGK